MIRYTVKIRTYSVPPTCENCGQPTRIWYGMIFAHKMISGQLHSWLTISSKGTTWGAVTEALQREYDRLKK